MPGGTSGRPIKVAESRLIYVLLMRHCEKYLVTQEVITIDSEADVRTRWEVIHSVKG